MTSDMRCVACDLIIDPNMNMEKTWKDLVPFESSSPEESPQQLQEEKDNNSIQTCIPPLEIWSAFCKYMIEGRTRKFRSFRSSYLDDLTFCPFCMRLIKKIYSFDQEISQIHERIDSMINCLKTKIQVSLDSSSYRSNNNRDKYKIRAFMLGLKQVPSPKNTSETVSTNDPVVLKDLRIVLSRIDGQKILPRSSEDGDEKKVKIKVERRPEKKSQYPGEPNNLEMNNEKNHEQNQQRKSSRVRKKPKYPDFHEGTPKKPNINQNLKIDHSDNEGVHVNGDNDDSFDGFGLEIMEYPEVNAQFVEDHLSHSKNADAILGPKFPPRPDQPPRSIKKRRQMDNRTRKTERRRLLINHLDEPDLFEWKGFKFRKLDNGKLKCEECASILNSQPCLILHIRKIHLQHGVGVFPCDICGKSFTRAEILKAHTFIHSEKQYQCYICGKLYHQRPNLTHHLKAHAGNFKFRCDHENCGKSFLTRGQLSNHTRRHLGLKSFQCEYCSRLFVDRSELNRHLVSHAEQLPYKCEMCNSSFFIKYRLKRHYLNVHKVDPPESINAVDDSVIKMPPPPTVVTVVITEPDPGEQILGIPDERSPCEEINNMTGLNVVDTVFMEETVVTTEPSAEPVTLLQETNPHKELITFQSMLE